MLNIVLNRDGAVPLRHQLALQIEVAIVTGQLEPGRKLPSVRDLARRLGLHHNTVAAAYAELTARRLITARRGSGIYVSDRAQAGPPERAAGLDELVASFLELARARGYAESDVRGALREWVDRRPPVRVLILEPAPDIRAILRHEIAAALDAPVDAAGLEALDDERARDGALLVSSFYHSAAIRERLGPKAPLVTISLNPGRVELERLRRLPEGALLGIVSISPILLSTVSTVIASIRGDELLVRPVPFSDEASWRKLARAADVVICDSVSGARVAPHVRRATKVIELVPESTLDQLRERLYGADRSGVAAP